MTLTVEEILGLRNKTKRQNRERGWKMKKSTRKTSRSGRGKWGKNTARKLKKLNEILRLGSDDPYTDKKRNEIFLIYLWYSDGISCIVIYEEGLPHIQYGEIRNYLTTYTRRPFLIYDFATDPIWSSLYMRKIFFSFLSVWGKLVRYKNRLQVKNRTTMYRQCSIYNSGR